MTEASHLLPSMAHNEEYSANCMLVEQCFLLVVQGSQNPQKHFHSSFLTTVPSYYNDVCEIVKLFHRQSGI